MEIRMNKSPLIVACPNENNFELKYVSTVPDNTAIQWLKDRQFIVSNLPKMAYLVDNTYVGYSTYLYRSELNQWFLMVHHHFAAQN